MADIGQIRTTFGEQAERIYWPYQTKGRDRVLIDTIAGLFFSQIQTLLPDVVENYDWTSQLHHDIIKDKLHSFLVTGLKQTEEGKKLLHRFAQDVAIRYTTMFFSKSNNHGRESAIRASAIEFVDYLVQNNSELYSALYEGVDLAQGGTSYYEFSEELEKWYKPQNGK